MPLRASPCSGSEQPDSTQIKARRRFQSLPLKAHSPVQQLELSAQSRKFSYVNSFPQGAGADSKEQINE
jgi:hypothetical protein